jgi:hypothetical protein
MSVLNQILGQYGADRIGDTVIHNGDWVGVLALSDCTFAVGTAVGTGDAPETGDSITAGTFLGLPFSAIELSAGTLFAIRRQMA